MGLRKPIEAHDIYRNLTINDSAKLKEVFATKWEEEKSQRKDKAKISNVIWKIWLSKIIGYSFLYSITDIILRYFKRIFNIFPYITIFYLYRVAQCQCLGSLITYFSDPNAENELTYFYICGLILCALFSSLITSPYIMFSFQRGLQIRIAICSMIYDKVKGIFHSFLMINNILY